MARRIEIKGAGDFDEFSELNNTPKSTLANLSSSSTAPQAIPPSFAPSTKPARQTHTGDFEFSHQTGQLKISPEDRKIIRQSKKPSETANAESPLVNGANTEEKLDKRKQKKLDKLLHPKKKMDPRLKFGIIGTLAVVVVLALLAVGWVVSTGFELTRQIQKEAVLSNKPEDATGATTFLIVGNDSRSVEAQSDVKGARADTIMLLIHPKNSTGKGGDKPDALISFPRDTIVTMPDFVDSQGMFGKKGATITNTRSKINATFNYGGAPLLIRTVEDVTGLKIDHYVEVGFDALRELVDEVGGIWLCYDKKVDDPDSGLKWPGGCKDVDGWTALAFSRMRHADASEDLGRVARQRHVVQMISNKSMKIMKEGNLFNLFNAPKLKDIAGVTLKHLTFDDTINVWQIKDMVSWMANATDGGLVSTMPFEDMVMDKVLGSGLKIDLIKTSNFFRSIT